MKDKKIRILCIIASVLSVLAVVPIMFQFYEYSSPDNYGIEYSYVQYGFELYSDINMWWYLLIGILGIISLLWNLAYGAYAIIDGRYRNLTWRIARYGYFYGIVVGVINFAAIISNCVDALPAMWIYLVVVAAAVAIETVLVILKDEDTKSMAEQSLQ